MIDEQLRSELIDLIKGAYKYQFVGCVIIAGALFLVLEIPAWIAGTWSVPSLPGWVEMVELVIVVGTTLQLSWTFPGIISRLYASRGRSGAVRLLRLSPASTPGLRFVSDALAFGSSFLLACLVIAAVIGFVVHFSGAGATGIAMGLPVLIGVIVLLLVRFAIVPTGQLNWLIVDAKRPVLSELDARIRYGGRRLIGRSTQLAELATEQFAVLVQSDNLPFKSSAILQFVGIAVGAVAGYVVQSLF